MSVSTNEVHHNQMEDSVSEQKVSEGSLWGDRQELSFVLWVDLDTQTHSQNERAHTCDKARQKAIEGESANEQTVEELQRSC